MAKVIVILGDEASRQQFAQNLGHRQQFDVSQPPVSASKEVQVRHHMNDGAMLPYQNEERASSVTSGEMTPYEKPDREVNWQESGPTGGGPAGRQNEEAEGEKKGEQGLTPKDPELSDSSISSTDPRQILLQGIQQDAQNVMNGVSAYVERRMEQQQETRPPTETQPDSSSPANPARNVSVTQEGVTNEQSAERTLEREFPIDADFHEGREPQSTQQQDVLDAEFRVMDDSPAQATVQQSAQDAPEGSAPQVQAQESQQAQTPAQEPQGNTYMTREAERAASALDENKTIVVSADNYNPDVAKLIEQAQQDGHRVQTVVIGQQQGDSVKLSEAQMDALPDLSRDSHYVSVYAPNENGKMQMYATSYNEQPKLAPEVNQEVGTRMQIGIEQRSGHTPDVQSVDTFKSTHPAHTKLEASSQQQRGTDY